MPISDVTQAASASASAQQTTSSQMLGQDGFFKLLVAQMQLQDPLSPMDSNDLTAQMAQLSSLEQLTDLKENTGMLVLLLNSSIAQQSMLFAANMLGRGVVAVDPESNEEISGTVQGYQIKDEQIVFDVDGVEVPASWIIKATHVGSEG
ncbi:MAG: flagellar hook capping FlgD N-terminal domain-containing protein [Syntrophaceticus sp.]|nr:flagellar hook capping FlgD N-terminal domain-containing protein [Syntrophaceticus sp.]MDD4360398.1 flagellar hook capping FlgD N-terminal domain-containing protein [Syntrophaceticus sp.]MDD4783421.1 flagellar hook capping FlgD N-terminal domain-containing protein [Syntrophaceticus sp.]